MDPWHYCNNHHAFSWGCIMRRSDHYSRDLCETHPGSDRVIKYKASNRPLLTLCWEHSAGQYHCHSQTIDTGENGIVLSNKMVATCEKFEAIDCSMYVWALGYIIIPYLTWLSDRKKFISIRHWTSRNLFSDFTWLSLILSSYLCSWASDFCQHNQSYKLWEADWKF